MGSGEITKNRINLGLIKIFQICLKFDICGDSPPMGGCMGGWVDGWVNGWDQVKSLKIE